MIINRSEETTSPVTPKQDAAFAHSGLHWCLWVQASLFCSKLHSLHSYSWRLPTKSICKKKQSRWRTFSVGSIEARATCRCSFTTRRDNSVQIAADSTILHHRPAIVLLPSTSANPESSWQNTDEIFPGGSCFAQVFQLFYMFLIFH